MSLIPDLWTVEIRLVVLKSASETCLNKMNSRIVLLLSILPLLTRCLPGVRNGKDLSATADWIFKDVTSTVKMEWHSELTEKSNLEAVEAQSDHE